MLAEVSPAENQRCKSQLLTNHWRIKDEWLTAALLQIKDQHPTAAGDELMKHLYCMLLESDLTRCGSGGLPQNCNQIERAVLAQPVVVQIESCRDSSQSLQEEQSQKQKNLRRNPGYSYKRTLSLRVTDGIQYCTCLEIAAIPSLPTYPPPGCKFIMLSAAIRHGIFLLDRESILFLGGSCQRCIDEQKAVDDMISSELGLYILFFHCYIFYLS